MEQVLSSGSSMITEASGNAREIAEQIGAQPTLEGLIVTGIVGLLICSWSEADPAPGGAGGLFDGSADRHWSCLDRRDFRPYLRHRSVCLRGGAGCIVVFLYKFGVFCVVFCVCLGMGVQIADPQSTLPLVIVW